MPLYSVVHTTGAPWRVKMKQVLHKNLYRDSIYENHLYGKKSKNCCQPPNKKISIVFRRQTTKARLTIGVKHNYYWFPEGHEIYFDFLFCSIHFFYMLKAWTNIAHTVIIYICTCSLFFCYIHNNVGSNRCTEACLCSGCFFIIFHFFLCFLSRIYFTVVFIVYA